MVSAELDGGGRCLFGSAMKGRRISESGGYLKSGHEAAFLPRLWDRGCSLLPGRTVSEGRNAGSI